jgi:hypothetical protein
MNIKIEALTDDEVEFIIDSLNLSWNTAHDELQRTDLGDIQKKNLEHRKKFSKLIMSKLGVHV